MLNAKLKFFVFSVIIFSAIFFIGNNVKAAIDVDIIQGSWLNNFDYPSYPVGGNTFIPSHDNISHLWTDGFAQVTSSISICKGIPAPTSQADLNTNGPTCNWSGNELIYNTGQIEKTWITISSSPPDILMFEFPEIVPLVIGENYYYIQEFISNEGGFTFMSCPSGYGGGRILETLNANETMMFGTYSVSYTHLR